jgi:hypothetical protein
MSWLVAGKEHRAVSVALVFLFRAPDLSHLGSAGHLAPRTVHFVTTFLSIAQGIIVYAIKQ